MDLLEYLFRADYSYLLFDFCLVGIQEVPIVYDDIQEGEGNGE